MGAGLAKSKLKVIHRADSSRQLSYAGHPLYRFIGDSKPGDVNGEGITAFGGTWHAVAKSGAPVAPAGGGGVPTNPGYGP